MLLNVFRADTKPIRLSSIIHFTTGVTLYGHTRELGLNGVAIELASLPNPKQQINIGDAGLLSLRYTDKEIEEHIRVRCQVTHRSANGMGVSIRFYELNQQEQNILLKLLVCNNRFSLH